MTNDLLSLKRMQTQQINNVNIDVLLIYKNIELSVIITTNYAHVFDNINEKTV